MDVAVAGILRELAVPDKEPHSLPVSPAGEPLQLINSMYRPSVYDDRLRHGASAFQRQSPSQGHVTIESRQTTYLQHL